VQRGRTLTRLGRPADARAAFDRAVQLAPKWPFAFENRGAFRHFERDLEGAASDFLRAVELAPSEAYPRQMLARVRFEQGRRDEALRQVDEAIRLAPEDASLRELRKSLQESPIPATQNKAP
jgi:Flp pilus assembly protein TadD